MATLGQAINFGFTGTNGIAITGVSGVLQSVNWKKTAKTAEIADGDGDTASITSYDARDEVDLELIVIGTSAANAILYSYPPAVNSFLPITTCTSLTGLVSNYWVVQNASVSGSNTDAKKLSLSLALMSGITVTAS